MSNQEIKNDIVKNIENSENILVLAGGPDGDAIGASLSLISSLSQVRKKVTAVLNGAVPKVYNFLNQVDNLKSSLTEKGKDFIITVDCTENPVKGLKYSVNNGKLNIVISPEGESHISPELVSFSHSGESYDLIIIVDTANINLLGSLYSENKELFEKVPIINIDHHISNKMFGKYNLIDNSASSTCEILFDLYNKMGIKISPDVATALLTGILFDTKTFQNANTTPKSLTISAQLMAMGAKRKEIVTSIYKTKPLSMLKLWGTILNRVKTDPDLGMVWSHVTLSDWVAHGLDPEQGTDNIIDELFVGVPGHEVALLLSEKAAGFVSGSLRSTGSVNVNEFAKSFGGGGHEKAAGFRINQMTLPDAEKLVLEKAREFIKGESNLASEVLQKKAEQVQNKPNDRQVDNRSNQETETKNNKEQYFQRSEQSQNQKSSVQKKEIERNESSPEVKKVPVPPQKKPVNKNEEKISEVQERKEVKPVIQEGKPPVQVVQKTQAERSEPVVNKSESFPQDFQQNTQKEQSVQQKTPVQMQKSTETQSSKQENVVKTGEKKPEISETKPVQNEVQAETSQKDNFDFSDLDFDFGDDQKVSIESTPKNQESQASVNQNTHISGVSATNQSQSNPTVSSPAGQESKKKEVDEDIKTFLDDLDFDV